jgi:hypothetical protein
VLDLIILAGFTRPVVFLMASSGFLTRERLGVGDPGKDRERHLGGARMRKTPNLSPSSATPAAGRSSPRS